MKPNEGRLKSRKLRFHVCVFVQERQASLETIFMKLQKRKCTCACFYGSPALNLDTKWGGRNTKDSRKKRKKKKMTKTGQWCQVCVSVFVWGWFFFCPFGPGNGTDLSKKIKWEIERKSERKEKASEGEGEWQARRGWDHSHAAPCSNYNILCLECVNVLCVHLAGCICINGPLQGILDGVFFARWIMHCWNPLWVSHCAFRT